MAEEVGAGYLSLIPSARNFSRLAKAELKKALAGLKGSGVEVPVVPVFDQKLLDESVKASKKPLRVPVVLEPLNDKVKGDAGKVRVPVEIDDRSYFSSLSRLGRDTRSTVHQRVTVDVDRDRLKQSVAGAAADATKGGSMLGSLFTSGFGSTLLNPLIGIPALIAGVLAAPLVAAATGAAILSGGALAAVFAGAFLLRADPELQKATQGLLTTIQTTLTEAAKPLKGPFLEAIGIIGQAFRDIAPDIKTFFQTIADSGGIQELARGISGFIKSFAETGALQKLADAIGPVLTQIGMALPDIGNAVSQFIISITKPEVIEFVGKILRGVADLIRFLGGAIGFLAGFANETIDLFKALWNGLQTVWQVAQDVWNGLTLVGNAVVGALTANMDKVRPLAELLGKIFGGLLGSITDIPKKITTAFDNAKTLLLQAGKNVVQGLIDGIKNKLGPLANIASTMAGTIRDFLPFSPAKTGPLSGSGNPYHSGQVIAGDLAKGVHSQLPAVATAANQLAANFAPGRSAAAAPAAGGGFEMELIGSGDLLLQALREMIRIRYRGDVTAALGSR